MKGLLVFISIFLTVICQAQDLNDFKYVIVDNQYDFQKEPNEYRLNEMMVFEIKKRGISAFRNLEVLPQDLNRGTCNALSLRVNVSTGLRVKMTFEFVDCNGQIVLITKDGIGRTKNFEKAYREAIRDAMTSLDGLNYSYAASLDDRPSGIEKPIQVMQPSAVKPSLEITPSNGIEKDEPQTIPRPEMVELIDDEVYTTNSKEYKIHSTDSGFNMYKNNSLIGTLKKSASGCYLTVTTEFIGIGYKEENTIIIEYDKNGTQFLVFQKK
ncbi:hypothetical protein [Nonlabens ulvanivorans]|uniref:hypothetical protein n=1 Tax=Nonlabens ulvanivorans TaxID=906888 RepID=UPI002943BED7|nr:hypothetical protein [Nonlabens ulvanivorans]WOI22544.1 hypothetical protein R1T42_12810 [Nonlabens ulvanivorans]